MNTIPFYRKTKFEVLHVSDLMEGDVVHVEINDKVKTATCCKINVNDHKAMFLLDQIIAFAKKEKIFEELRRISSDVKLEIPHIDTFVSSDILNSPIKRIAGYGDEFTCDYVVRTINSDRHILDTLLIIDRDGYFRNFEDRDECGIRPAFWIREDDQK